MRIAPIPKRTLIHSVSYSEKRENGRYQNEEFENAQEIERVRMTLAEKIVTSGDNEDKLIRGSLLLCATNTTPFIKLVPESKIEFEGDTFTVDEVKPHFTDRLHHYEVILV